MGHWELMGVYNAVTTTYSAFAYTGHTSPFTPTESGRLKGIRIIEGSAAVTTVVTGVQFKFTCKAWKPNSIEFGYYGMGLHTAPRAYPIPLDWLTDQPVMAGVPITMEGRIVSGYTNVTPEIHVWGYFEP